MAEVATKNSPPNQTAGLIERSHTRLHQLVTGSRRVRVLSREIAKRLPDKCTVLDVGSGSGEIAQAVMSIKPEIKITGIDVLVRADTAIPVMPYNGETFPVADKSYDYVSFVDVLHHTPDPFSLLKEASRVARKGIILKDHNCNNYYTKRLLHFTDWFGNRAYGVHLEFNFLSRKEWQHLFNLLKLRELSYETRFGLYPVFTRLVFPGGLDFVSELKV